VKVVIVHDYLNQQGGAERVVAVLHELFPDAPIYTLFVDRAKLWPALRDATIISSWLRHFPFVMNNFKLFFWLYPIAVRTLSIPECDVVISSSSAYAKGIRIRRRGPRMPLHICYCHTPMRFAWHFEEYIAHETDSKLLVAIARKIVPLLKWWDVMSSRQVDAFVANSSAVKERIRRFYGRNAQVIFPPVDVRTPIRGKGSLSVSSDAPPGEYYLMVSRLVSYKRLSLAVEACTQLGKPLIVIGSGPDRQRLESIAGDTVTFLGWQPDEVVAAYMELCKALIFPGEEDFGITLVEANTHGKPVVAFQSGGALDTICPGVNGVFFREASVEALAKALDELDNTSWDATRIRAWASRFSRQHFQEVISGYIRSLALAAELSSRTAPLAEN